jgi:hypothetical protein
MFRNTFAVELLKKNVSLEHVAMLLADSPEIVQVIIRGMKIGKLWRFITDDLVVGPGSEKNRDENRVRNRRRRTQNRANYCKR